MECGQLCANSYQSHYYSWSSADLRCSCGANSGPSWNMLTFGNGLSVHPAAPEFRTYSIQCLTGCLEKGVDPNNRGYFITGGARDVTDGLYRNTDSHMECGQLCANSYQSHYYSWSSADLRCSCGANSGPSWNMLTFGNGLSIHPAAPEFRTYSIQCSTAA